MRRRPEVLVAVLDPLDRAAQGHGVEARQQVLGIGAQLESEAAAHIGCDHPHGALVEPQRLGELLADEVGHLRRDVDRQLPGARLPLGQHGPGLHGQARHPVHVEPTLDHHVGLPAPSLHVPLALGVGDQEIGIEHLAVDHRSPRRQRPIDVGDVRERLVVDLDQVEGVLGHVPGRGGDAHDGLPLVGGLVPRQREMGDRRRTGHRPQDPDGLGAGGHLRSDQDLPHPREGEGGGDVDPVDPGVRVGASPDGHLHRVGRVDVVREAARSPQQPVVLLARDVGAHDGRPHVFRDVPDGGVSHGEPLGSSRLSPSPQAPSQPWLRGTGRPPRG